MEPDDTMAPILLTGERVARLKDAVALATGGAFDEAIEQLAVVSPDSFSEVEEMFRIFFQELKETTERVDTVIAELEASRQELVDKLQTIAAQQTVIRVLSTPIVDAWEGVLAVPLLGLVDAARALEMREKLLGRIAESRARWVIIDLTSVEDIDVETAHHLVSMARAVRLLGSRCLLTGITPSIATAIVTIGADLGDLKPLRSLQEGLRHCLAEESRRKKSSAELRGTG